MLLSRCPFCSLLFFSLVGAVRVRNTVAQNLITDEGWTKRKIQQIRHDEPTELWYLLPTSNQGMKSNQVNHWFLNDINIINNDTNNTY